MSRDHRNAPAAIQRGVEVALPVDERMLAAVSGSSG
jgi:hypothetical protein